MNHAFNIVGILALCLGSAVMGRFVLTRDDAWRTISVRLPAILRLLAFVLVVTFCWTVGAVICFVGGSFYGLSHWWWPRLFEVLEGTGELICPIITGTWE